MIIQIKKMIFWQTQLLYFLSKYLFDNLMNINRHKYIYILTFLSFAKEMIFDNKHIHQSLKNVKQRIIITPENPLVLVISSTSSFLNHFCQSIIKYYQIDVIIKVCTGNQNMDYVMPYLSLNDYALDSQNLVEFLCDIALSKYQILQYTERKENIKNMYRNWSRIFNHQDISFHQKGQIQIALRKQLANKIFQQFLSFSLNILGKNYEKNYKKYSEEQYKLEVVMMIDIIQTILKDFPKSKTDYVLRGFFQKQIDFTQEQKAKYQTLPGHKFQQFGVLLDKRQKYEPVRKNFSSNVKWFGGMIIGLSFIFGKWAR